MEGIGAKFWGAARLVIFFTSVFYIASANETVADFDNFDAALISVFIFFGLSVWLFLHRKRTGTGLDTSISFSGPFWPMIYHPYQFWTLSSVTAICGGIVNISAVFVSGHGSSTIGFVSFFMGISIALAIGIQRYIPQP
ncbi:MAG: hypothetical protein KGH75_11215 [Rhodospirillales bacterium]|nr:hypothetical protein [Rhodospirillales bacterium]